jgi:hypothetical protein
MEGRSFSFGEAAVSSMIMLALTAPPYIGGRELVHRLTPPEAGANIGGGGLVLLAVCVAAGFAGYLNTRRVGFGVPRVILSVAVAVAVIAGVNVALAPTQGRLSEIVAGIVLVPWATGGALIGAGLAKRRGRQLE